MNPISPFVDFEGVSSDSLIVIRDPNLEFRIPQMSFEQVDELFLYHTPVGQEFSLLHRIKDPTNDDPKYVLALSVGAPLWAAQRPGLNHQLISYNSNEGVFRRLSLNASHQTVPDGLTWDSLDALLAYTKRVSQDLLEQDARLQGASKTPRWFYPSEAVCQSLLKKLADAPGQTFFISSIDQPAQYCLYYSNGKNVPIGILFVSITNRGTVSVQNREFPNIWRALDAFGFQRCLLDWEDLMGRKGQAAIRWNQYVAQLPPDMQEVHASSVQFFDEVWNDPEKLLGSSSSTQALN